MTKRFDTGLVWLRRDLRLNDHAALSLALERCKRVHCVFVFDRSILDELPRSDRRVEFIHESIIHLDAELNLLSGNPAGGLIVLHDFSAKAIPALAAVLCVQCVFCSRDYEPYATDRDATVQKALHHQGIAMEMVKDHVIFEQREVLTQSGKPYGVFTPYMKAWLALLHDTPPRQHSCQLLAGALAPRPALYSHAVPTLEKLGFSRTNLHSLGIRGGSAAAAKVLDDFWGRIDTYDQTRNFPGIKGPSYLGVHLRFGTISIRQLVGIAMQRKLAQSTGAATWLAELIWRDFYFQIVANYPHVSMRAFKPEYDKIAWQTGAQADAQFAAWRQGLTGYPLVDAAMNQLNQTGYMHNRLRMVAGSFLVKHLGLDWRRGEAYFAEKLNDFDLSANNGGWQWVSSSGCDAQPYFRIFNPVSQSEKFDAEGKFIKRYLPQLSLLDARSIHAPWNASSVELASANVILGHDYPHPIVDHAQARATTLQRYAVVRKISQLSTADAQ
jgi:deoxyribodipyrimidine photo-lyase